MDEQLEMKEGRTAHDEIQLITGMNMVTSLAHLNMIVLSPNVLSYVSLI